MDVVRVVCQSVYCCCCHDGFLRRHVLGDYTLNYPSVYPDYLTGDIGGF